MIYIQHVVHDAQTIDEIVDVAETPEEAADSFEKHMTRLENYEYNRAALIQVLSSEEEAQVLPTSPDKRGNHYVLFGRV